MNIAHKTPNTALKICLLSMFVLLGFYSINAHAAIDNAGLMNNVLDKYAAVASTWGVVITKYASWLFWTLSVISLVWTFGMMALRKADVGEFFAEFIRFTLFTGFYWWLLKNGPNFAVAIMDSLRQIAAEATGMGAELRPSGIVDIGFQIFSKVASQTSGWEPVDSAIGVIMSVVILVVMALIAVNMLILLISGWILAYAGVFFLGFGGSRWTSEMAIGYFKTTLSVGAQLFTMVLLVGIGKSFVDQYYTSMDQGKLVLNELGVMLVVAIVLLTMVTKIPPLIGSLGGAQTHAIGNGFGAGAALGAAAMGAAAAATAGAALAAGGTSIAGGVQALMAAYSQANAADSAGGAVSDLASSMGGGESEGSSGGGGSPLATAMGDSDSGGGASLASAANSSVFEDSSSTGGSGSSSAGASNSTDQQSGSASAGSDPTGRTESAPGEVKSGGALAAASAAASKVGSAAGAAAAKVGRVAAGTATNLAQGTWDVAKAKGGEIKGAALDRISETTGGKIASAINARAEANQAEPSEENSLSSGAAQEVDAETAEVIAAFVNRDSKSA